MPSSEVVAAVERAHRAEWGIILAGVARLLDGDVGAAEECTQEAFVAALESWEAPPSSPGGWLTTVARRRALDRLRRDVTLRRRLPALLERERDDEADPARMTDREGDVVGDGAFGDDRLRLVFTCCHPALSPEARSALTLRMCCGITTAEIARVFLTSEPTMAARLTRAKKKIAAAGIPFRVPTGDELPPRLDGVLTVIHLLGTAGHAAAGERLVRDELTDRALDLARTVNRLMPGEPEAWGLTALMECTVSRQPARTDAQGRLVLLEAQDRSRWDQAGVARGLAALDRGLALLTPQRRPGRFLLQGAIAAVHAEAPRWEDTDWPAVLALYDRLGSVWPTPVVAVNRAVALSFVAGPEAGLAALDAVDDDPALARYHYLPAARAELLQRCGRPADAAAAYRAAIALADPGPERNHLEARLAGLA